ncbi:Uu.00g060070.m01.CDS01 [Anthostomella pinea]|uniref:Uu.00g060070.m01.CDS01 n=1 Tax=Anthostomella pinea TaxID=933095 RepID=A0AAI8VTD1_9PEZI|nr:Uu.00g060070.m01.CDS01 [Anthostomella pinea]
MKHCKSGNCWISIANNKVTIHDHKDGNKPVYDTDIDDSNEAEFDEWAMNSDKRQRRGTSPNPPGRNLFARDGCTQANCPDGDTTTCIDYGGASCINCYQTGTNGYTCSY